MLDMSERENILSWLFFFRDFFLAVTTGKEQVQIISYSTHSVGIAKSLNWSKETFKAGQKRQSQTWGICRSGRKRLKIQGRTLQCWEVWQLIKKQLSWFFERVVFEVQSHKVHQTPFLTHIHLFSPDHWFQSLCACTNFIPFLNEIQATQEVMLCRLFTWKKLKKRYQWEKWWVCQSIWGSLVSLDILL